MKKVTNFVFLSFASFLFLTGLNVSAQNCTVSGGTISTQDFTGNLCSNDGIPDIVNFNVSGNTGTNSRLILTNSNGIIVGIHESLTIDFEGSPTATYIVWNISYETGITGLAIGGSISNLSGCYSLSSGNVVVTTFTFFGGFITAQNGSTEISFCVDDGVVDIVTPIFTNTITFGGLFAITDLSGNILQVEPFSPNFEGTGEGIVHLYFIASCHEVITNVFVGMNINNLPADTEASNAITVTKTANCCTPDVITCPPKKVLMCFNGTSICVPQKQVNKLLQQGAALGACLNCNTSGQSNRKGITMELTDEADAVRIFPNPVNGDFWISLPSNSKAEGLELRNVAGQLVWKKNLNTEFEKNIFVSVRHLNLTPGIYLLIVTDKGSRTMKKVVITK